MSVWSHEEGRPVGVAGSEWRVRSPVRHAEVGAHSLQLGRSTAYPSIAGPQEEVHTGHPNSPVPTRLLNDGDNSQNGDKQCADSHAWQSRADYPEDETSKLTTPSADWRRAGRTVHDHLQTNGDRPT